MVPLVCSLSAVWTPFGLASEYSLLNLVSKYTTKTVAVGQGFPEITMTNSIMGANSYFPVVYKTDLLAACFVLHRLFGLLLRPCSSSPLCCCTFSQNLK